MVIQHNLMAMNAQRQYGITSDSKAKSTEKLSSGYRINRAADDAAGLAISEKMRRQIRGLTQASENSQDGISLIQTAEGGLGEVHDMIQRLNELSIKAANGTLTEADRSYVDQEFQSLKKEINRVAGSTTFNEIQLFPPDGSSISTSSFDIKVNADGTYTVALASTDVYSVGTTTATENATQTAEYLAGLIPSTISSILDKYTNLDNVGDLTVKLDLSYIDGANGTLAYAAYSYYPSTHTAVENSFLVKVDTADFTDSNALEGGDRNDLLKATLAHELTHTIMQHTLTRSMTTDMPQWFIEGSAQMSGGGFSTGWLSELTYIINDPTTDDATKAAKVETYLKKYTVDGRPYGHGYLATAYAAYLAGGSDINNMAAGLNDILGRIKSGDSFEQAIQNATGMSASQITNAINSGSPAATAFTKSLAEAVGTGAGSVLSANLSDGTQRMGTVPADGSTSTQISAADRIILQVGSEQGNEMELSLFSIGTRSLGLENANVLTAEDAKTAITSAKNALGVVSSIRSYYGATQNRLEHTIKNLDNVVENTTAAESAIRDTDMAKEMVAFSMKNILEQAGVSMMTQANQANQTVLSLLQ